MSYIKFIKKESPNCFEYHLKSKLNDFFDSSLFPLSPKLSKSVLDDWAVYLWEKGITYSASQENSVLYTVLLDYFRQDYETQIIYDGNKDDFAYIKKTPEECRWRYSIEFTTDDSDLCKDFGFLNPNEFYKIVNYSNQETSGYYSISDFEKEYTAQFIKMYNCDVSNWSFIYSKNPLAVKQLLSINEVRPNKKVFFEIADILINIQIGGDEGYLDYILIISNQNLDLKIAHIEKKINLLIKNYESLLLKLGEIDSEQKINQFKVEFSHINK